MTSAFIAKKKLSEKIFSYLYKTCFFASRTFMFLLSFYFISDMVQKFNFKIILLVIPFACFYFIDFFSFVLNQHGIDNQWLDSN